MQDESRKNRNPFILRMLGLGKSYFVKTPWWLKQVYPGRIWNRERNEKNIYLSFDDGPEPSITKFVLDELKRYNAKATFFCIGKNVEQHASLYQQILNEGHATGNHTQNHLNGWETKDDVYAEDVKKAAKHVQSDLFRPPYGRLKFKQASILKKSNRDIKIVMWDVLSGDFDENCSAKECIENVKRKSRPGSIVVLHDNKKTKDKLQVVLPEIMRFFSEKGYAFKALK